jgi:hypothetical protein
MVKRYMTLREPNALIAERSATIRACRTFGRDITVNDWREQVLRGADFD